MNQKLTDQQIEELFNFCSKHKVEFYDLQIELVDHLAAGIEESMALEGRLSFEEALSVQFKEFGDKGFSGIIRNKRRTLNRKYSNLQWRLVGEYFKLPKIILTLFITLVVFIGFRFSNNDLKYGFILFFIYDIVLMASVFPFYKSFKLNLVTEKKFLLHDRLRIFERRLNLIRIFPLVLTMIYISFRNHSVNYLNLNIFIEFILSFLITFYIVVCFVAPRNIPKQIKEDFTKEFPEFVKTRLVAK